MNRGSTPNYFVFDLSGVSSTITAAKLKLFTGVLETADPFELYAMHEIGSKVVLSGFVPTAMPPAFPQQPFGFTGPDIPAGSPLTPLLDLTLAPVPEPSTVLLLAAGVVCLVLRRARR